MIFNSLLRALMSESHKAPRLTAEDLTDGIAINTWTIEHNDREVSYSTWDFAGQTVYYNTHQVTAAHLVLRLQYCFV